MIAVVAGCAFFAWLAVHLRRARGVSIALWIPTIWLSILASRPIILWFESGGAVLGANVEEGSQVDRLLLSALMGLAVVVLWRRRLDWIAWVQANSWLVAFLLYCAMSIVWSDFPGIAVKRWSRALGSVLMILVVLSERDPRAAISTVARRCIYFLVPLSLLLIKYYRDVAVGYNQWTGEEYLVGIATDKNGLGRLCLVSGLFLVWHLYTRRSDRGLNARISQIMDLGLLALTGWLLLRSKSATALASFIVGLGAMSAAGLPVVRQHARRLGVLVTVSLVVVWGIDLAFDLTEVLVARLGRNMTFTDRIYIWEDLWSIGTNPIFGVGYDSFWLGERLLTFVEKHQVNEAHNGYLEVYLELGLMGLGLFAGVLWSLFVRAKRALAADLGIARLRVAFLAVFLLYNMFETGYKATTLMFFVLLLVGLDGPARQEVRPVGARVVRRVPLRSAVS